MDFLSSASNKEPAYQMGWIPGLGRFPGGGHGNPLQYSCLENPMDRGGWRSTVHGVAKSQTLKRRNTHNEESQMSAHRCTAVTPRKGHCHHSKKKKNHLLLNVLILRSNHRHSTSGLALPCLFLF